MLFWYLSNAFLMLYVMTVLHARARFTWFCVKYLSLSSPSPFPKSPYYFRQVSLLLFALSLLLWVTFPPQTAAFPCKTGRTGERRILASWMHPLWATFTMQGCVVSQWQIFYLKLRDARARVRNPSFRKVIRTATSNKNSNFARWKSI